MGYGNGGDASARTMAVGDGSGPNSPPPQLPVASAMGDLDMQIGNLREHISSLKSRLGPVLGPSLPTSENAKVGVQRTGLAGGISEAATALAAIRADVRDLLDRLEI